MDLEKCLNENKVPMEVNVKFTFHVPDGIPTAKSYDVYTETSKVFDDGTIKVITTFKPK